MTEKSFVVCGWYTPDYAVPWGPRLWQSLDDYGAPHDFVEVPKLTGGWEANTMRKAHEVLRAMERHPDKVVIFLDIDCEVRGSLEPLAQIRADVGCYIRVKRRRNGAVKWGSIRSGTLVLSQTVGARAFVTRWIEEGQNAHYGDVDQNTLMLALGRTPGVTFQNIGIEYCATRSDGVAEPIVFHDSASKDLAKIKRWHRSLRRLVAAWSAQWRRAVGRGPCTDPRSHCWVTDTHGEPMCRHCGARRD